MPKCAVCGKLTVTPSMLSDHECDEHNVGCPEPASASDEICSKCGEISPVANFRPEPRKLNGISSWCRDCDKVADRARREANPYKRYGLNRESYDRLLESQGGACPACGSPLDDGSSVVVDHNHDCCEAFRSCGKCVRGILHKRCNSALGFFRDDPARLEMAASYLRKHL